MTAAALTLTDFLLARIAEDEAVVSDWVTDGQWGLHSPGQMWVDTHGRPIYAPRARVLAECEAKRRIVEEHSEDHHCVRYADVDDNRDCHTVRFLAAVYASHPDYRDEWRA